MPRPRLFAHLTWPQVRDAVHRGAGVIVPIGSTEQHGYHMALCTDVVLPTELALAVAEPLDLLVAPPVCYGYRSRPLSGGGQSFPGTVSVSAQTLISLVCDILSDLMRNGFRRIVLLNWHYENANFIYEAAYLAYEATPMGVDPQIMVIEAPFAELSDDAMVALFGNDFPGWDVEHAGILETSLMLHLHPELVLFDRAVDDQAARHPSYDIIPPPSDFIPESGTLWKATCASAAKGAVAWPEIVAYLGSAIETDLPHAGTSQVPGTDGEMTTALSLLPGSGTKSTGAINA